MDFLLKPAGTFDERWVPFDSVGRLRLHFCCPLFLLIVAVDQILVFAVRLLVDFGAFVDVFHYLS